jgi:lipopolysaccharide/colanic/teichoic acid biosynthesis glycosyltransferase
MQHLQVQIAIVPRLFELVGPNVGIHTVEGVPMLGLPPLDLSRSSRVLKRATDVLIAGGALLLLCPVFLAIAVAVKRGSPGPVFFRQVRIGTGGRPFRLLKFRTMVEDADERKEEFAHLNLHLARDPRMFKIANDPRVTRSGRYLRRYFLDELPQLVNVLRGEMSLIGPRPLIPQEARFVGAWGNRRLDLKPGMTGLWQVLGRSAMPFDEMVKLDYLYVTTWSLGNDLKLLVRTLPLVARGESAV